MAEGAFREDLFFRLAVITIDLPPLRARGNDVLRLAQEFLDRAAARAQKRITGMTSPVAQRLLAYPWPGNVRELEAAIERAVALTRFDQITVEDLPARLRDHKPQAPSADEVDLLPLEEIERRHVLRVLDAVGGNKRLAAKILRIDRGTLYRKLGRYDRSDEGASDS